MSDFDTCFEAISDRLEKIAIEIGKEFDAEPAFYDVDDGSGFHLELQFSNLPVYVTAMLVPEDDVEIREAERGNVLIRIEDYRGECQTYAAGNYSDDVWCAFDNIDGFENKLERLGACTPQVIETVQMIADRLNADAAPKL